MKGTLSPDDRRLLEELFDQAAELPPAEHAAFVLRACGDNEALAYELGRLLAGLAGEDIVRRIQPVAATKNGTQIGPYRLLERIGEGGMGEVYAAEQLDPVIRTVALKLIKPGMDSAQVVVRFEAERQALARMTHPHVAQVYGGGTTDDGRPYFVMELVAGEPITDYCDERALSTRARLELFLGVCEGVQHAHQKGLIHRDLKPSNLLVMEQDDRAVPKVIDFGVARAITGTLADRTLHTMVGQLVGTLDYMSPEQADPTGVNADTRSDVYSLGVVLYQLVSGLLPFNHGSSTGTPLSEVQRAIREQDPPTPSTRLRRQTDTARAIAKHRGVDERSLVRQLSGDLDWICLKALEKDPERRYASVAELAADVRRHLAYEPVLAGRPGALYRARKFVRRHRVGVMAGALVAASVVAGIVGIVSARNEAEDNATRAENALVELTMASAPGLLEVLKEEADEQLWPPRLDDVPAYDAWLADALALVADLEPAAGDSYTGHRRQLEALRAMALPRTEQERQADREGHPRFAEWQARRDPDWEARYSALRAGEAELKAGREKYVGVEGAAAIQDEAAQKQKLSDEGESLAALVSADSLEDLDTLGDLDAALDERRSFTFAKVEDARAHQQLVALIEELEELSDPETGLIAGTGIDPEHGWSVRRRREYAIVLTERSLDGSEARERWSRAITEIADRELCPAYDGLQLSPQLGLLPLGRDPESGLWEFAHLMSGEPAARDPETGELAVSYEMGLVLVLLPGGAFTMGAQSEDPDGPNYDPDAFQEEGPPYVASLPPFFLSKFEMTRAQWLRFAGTRLGVTNPIWGLRPVWGPSQVECMTVTRRLGLSLPTEEQWEYAARAGTSTIWWTGNEVASLEGAENIYDRKGWKQAKFARGEDPVDWEDAHGGFFDVGSFRANPFGLFDVNGNVSEWCRSHKYNYKEGPDQPRLDAQFRIRVARGGNSRSAQVTSRPTWRGFSAHEAFSDPTTGLRPSRAIDP